MSEFIRLDPSGQVTPEDEHAQRSLGERAGRYYVAPTSPDLLLAVRAPCMGGSAAKPRVIMAGDLSGMPLADFVAFLNQSRTTGVLRVVTPAGERAIVFKTGEVRGAASDDPTDRIAEIAVRLGMVERRKVDEVMATKPHSSRVGRILVEQKLIQPHDLWKCVQHQVSEIFHSILLSREGAFMLVDQEVEDRGTALRLNTQGLLMDSIRRIDEMAEFRKRIPSSGLYISKKKPADAELEPEEKIVYDLCTGDRTISELAMAARMTEFETTKVIHHLLSGGYVSKSETGTAAPAAKGPADPTAVARAFNGIFKEIVSEVDKLGMRREFVAAANNALVGQAGKTPVLGKLQFAQDGTLDHALVLANTARLNEPPIEAAKTLKSALSELMFFLLFQAGDLLEPSADEDLARRVKEQLAVIEDAS